MNDSGRPLQLGYASGESATVDPRPIRRLLLVLGVLFAVLNAAEYVPMAVMQLQDRGPFWVHPLGSPAMWQDMSVQIWAVWPLAIGASCAAALAGGPRLYRLTAVTAGSAVLYGLVSSQLYVASHSPQIIGVPRLAAQSAEHLRAAGHTVQVMLVPAMLAVAFLRPIGSPALLRMMIGVAVALCAANLAYPLQSAVYIAFADASWQQVWADWSSPDFLRNDLPRAAIWVIALAGTLLTFRRAPRVAGVLVLAAAMAELAIVAHLFWDYWVTQLRPGGARVGHVRLWLLRIACANLAAVLPAVPPFVVLTLWRQSRGLRRPAAGPGSGS